MKDVTKLGQDAYKNLIYNKAVHYIGMVKLKYHFKQILSSHHFQQNLEGGENSYKNHLTRKNQKG